MEKYKVSIVVPVFNANRGGYLSRLINCVLEQPYKNIELLLIDNGSSDDSLHICEQYAEKDSRVVVTTEEKRGASAARNRGLQIATGDYIHICDADDLIENDIYCKCMEIAENYEPDVIRFNFATYQEDIFATKTIIQQPYEALLERKYIIDEVVPYTIGIKVNAKKKIDGHWTLITKRNVIEDNCIRYNENQAKEEDHPFLVSILAYAQTIVFLSGTYYHYLKHSGSLISTYSPRFRNFCNNFALYEKLFSAYYDFNSKVKIQYNIDCAIDALEYVVFHYRDCNIKHEILEILKSEEIKKWVKLLEPKNEIQYRLKRCVETASYSKFYYFMIWRVIKIRLNNLARKMKLR